MKLKKSLCFLVPFLIAISVLSTADAKKKKHPVAEQVKDRRPSFPIVTGDGFRNLATFLYDETSKNINPSLVSSGAVLFVKTDYLAEFFTYVHPYIMHPYVLVTHNSDNPAPGPCRSMLEDPRIIAWYGQNVEGYSHDKLHPIPIGLENRYNANGNPDVVLQAIEDCKYIGKEWLLYMNFTIGTSPDERTKVYNRFKDKPYCKMGQNKKYRHYLQDLALSKFVLCPRGNGLDTHRAWEALYMGAIPIVKSSSMDPIFDGLPVVIVNDWNEIDEEFLIKTYTEMRNRSYSLDKLHMSYWTQCLLESRDAYCHGQY